MKKIFCYYLLPFIMLYVSCEKEKTPQYVTTSPVTSITDTTIITGGTINDFENVVGRGVCWDTVPNPKANKLKTVDGEGPGSFTSVIKSFLPYTKYYVRAYAYNASDTVYGQDETFVTNKSIPVVSTDDVTLIKSTTASINGSIIKTGGENIISYGVCWSTNPNPTVAANKITNNSANTKFRCDLTGLAFYTKYYARAFAENARGIAYGPEISFTTRTEFTVKDYDGNVYNTCTIGVRVFMMENLKVTHYRNGDPISYVPDGLSWDHLSTGAYCFYNNETTNKNIYGALYNWYAVSDDRKLAPEGWHVMTESEWRALHTYLGGMGVAPAKMKVKGADYSADFNAGATNESNFSVVPNGMRFKELSGHFQDINSGAFFWTGTKCTNCSGEDYAHSVWISDNCAFYVDEVGRGFAVRCIKD